MGADIQHVCYLFRSLAKLRLRISKLFELSAIPNWVPSIDCLSFCHGLALIFDRPSTRPIACLETFNTPQFKIEILKCDLFEIYSKR